MADFEGTFFPNKFKVGGTVLRTDQNIEYINTNTFASPSFTILADSTANPPFSGTGADIAALSPVAGQHAFCTVTGSGFVIDNEYVRNSANNGWVVIAGSEALSAMPIDTVIGNYTLPVAAAASSVNVINTTEVKIYDNIVDNATNSLLGATFNRSAWQFLTGSRFIGKTITKIGMRLQKGAGASGTVNIRLRNSSDTILQEIANFDASTLSTSVTMVEWIFTFIPALNDRLTIEYSGATQINTKHDSGAPEANADIQFWNGSAWSARGWDMGGRIYIKDADAVIDDLTSTKVQTDSENNPWVSVDNAASLIAASIAIHSNANTTETEVRIQTSPDNAVWTTRRTLNISDFAHGVWNYIKLPNIKARYYRIFGTGTSKILSINEMKVKTVTDLTEHLHNVPSPGVAGPLQG